MENINRIVLLIVPEFPPNDSIGGRRWAKFAKYLAKKNVVVKVIAFEPKQRNGNSNWVADITHPNIEVFYVPSYYPAILQSTSSNFIVRIVKKICSLSIALYDGGIIQDKAIFFKKTLLKKAGELIRKYEIQNVICSGPYHRASYFTTLLKKEYSNLNVIIDFRDRWTDGQVYGIEKVGHSAFLKESALQKYTCEQADVVISTYAEILKELKQEYKSLPENKFIHFPHNFDLDDYPDASTTTISKTQKNRIKFIYGGTINTAAFNDAFKSFFYALRELKDKEPDTYKLLEIEIYGENYQLNQLVASLGISDRVSIYPKTGEVDFYQKVAESDFPMIFLGAQWKDLMTTKSIAYLPFRKPILVVSEAGGVSKMVLDNKLGFHLSPGNCFENLLNLLHNYQLGKLEFDPHFDFSRYSYEAATDKLIQLLKF